MSSIRKKRNFKGLQLGEPSLPPALSSAPGPSAGTAAAPLGLGGSSLSSRGTPATTASSSSSLSANALGAGNPSALAAGEIEPSSGANYHNTLTEQLKNLELGVEYKLDLKSEDLKLLSELGSGNGGTVTKVLHEKSGTVMAKKTVFIDAKPAVRKQILRELQILHECNSPHIVSFYGAYLSEPHICMCMEFMDKSSLDTIWKRWGPVPADICGQVAVTVVRGLTYLYDAHRIIHRDVKPSNILVSSKGEIKICDFGVSGELINSIADTFVGTSTYMSPERIQGDQYSVKSDVWSLGITIIEIALGRFPFAEEGEHDKDDDSGDEDDGEEGSDGHTANGDRHDDEDEEDDLRGTLSPTRPNGSTPRAQQPSSSRRKKKKDRGSGGGGVSLGGGTGQMSMLELLQRIVNEPPPRLPVAAAAAPEPSLPSTSSLQHQRHSRVAPSPSTSQQEEQASRQSTSSSKRRISPRRSVGFPRDLVAFVDLCVTKDPNARPTPRELGGGSGGGGGGISGATNGKGVGGASSSSRQQHGSAASDLGRDFVRKSEERRDRGEVDVKAWVDTLV